MSVLLRRGSKKGEIESLDMQVSAWAKILISFNCLEMSEDIRHAIVSSVRVENCAVR